MKNLLIFIIVFTCVVKQSIAQTNIDSIANIFKPLIISSDTIEKYTFEKGNIQFIADTAARFTIEKISSPEFANKFIPLAETTRNKIKSKTFWLKFTLKSNLTYDKEYILGIECFNANNDIPLVYIPLKNGKFLIKKNGAIPINERDFKHDGNANVLLLVRYNQTQTFYAKVVYNKRYELNAAIELQAKDDALEIKVSNRLANGIFLGIFLIMILYNSILYLSIKERSYLYYIFYIFCYATFILCSTGYGFEYIWSNQPNWASYIGTITGFLFLFFYVLFGKTYLNTKQLLPKWNKVITIQIIGLCLALAALPFLVIFGDGFSELLSQIVIIIMILFVGSSFIILLIPAILCLRKGIKHARYFLLGNIMVLLGIVLLIIGGIKSINILSIYGMNMGVVMEMIMFSVGIGAKVNALNKDKVKAQAEMIAQLEENEKLKDKVNRELEEKVKERTVEVVKQKELVDKAYAELHEKNKEVMDSIRYAKHIQTALITSEKAIQNMLNKLVTNR